MRLIRASPQKWFCKFVAWQWHACCCSCKCARSMLPKIRDPGKTKARILCIHAPKTVQMYFSIGGSTCLILPSDLVRVVCLDHCGGLGARTCRFQAGLCLSTLHMWTNWSWRLENKAKNMYVLGRGRLHSIYFLALLLQVAWLSE